MWVAGVLLLIAATAPLHLLLARTRRQELPPIVWDIPRVAGTYTTITGALAGFSVSSAIFIANLTVARESPEFESVIGMFLIGFLLFLGTAMIYGTTPNLPEGDEQFVRIQRLSFLLAGMGYYCGIVVSWLALRPLLLAIQLPYAADVFTWVLLVAIVSGGTRMSNFLVHLTLLDRKACMLAPVSGFLTAGIYGLGLAELFPELLPRAHAPFLFAVAIFALAVVGFGAHTAGLACWETERGRALVDRLADSLALVYVQALATLAGLLWLIVART